MDAISLVTGAVLGIMLCTALNAFLYMRRNPDLPPINGHIVVKRKDGSQHYRKLPQRTGPIQSDAFIDHDPTTV